MEVEEEKRTVPVGGSSLFLGLTEEHGVAFGLCCEFLFRCHVENETVQSQDTPDIV